jgi:hypothetical protein
MFGMVEKTKILLASIFEKRRKCEFWLSHFKKKFLTQKF